MNTKTTYISKDGLDKLRAELDEMVAVRRPEIAQRIHGLGLSDDVLRAVYHDNAARLIRF